MDIGGPEDECRFEAEAEITLIGMREDGRDVERFGQKFIGVDEGGHLQIHGAKKLSWTRFSLRSLTLNVESLETAANHIIRQMLSGKKDYLMI